MNLLKIKDSIKNIQSELDSEDVEKSVIRYKKEPLADVSYSWNASKEKKLAFEADGVIGLKRLCAWYDSENSKNTGAYKLPHHAYADGEYKTVWRGVAAAMGALFGARGGVDIPEDEMKAVYGHLAKHYKEFDKEPPEFSVKNSMESIRITKDTISEIKKSVGGIYYSGVTAKYEDHVHSYSLHFDVDTKIISGYIGSTHKIITSVSVVNSHYHDSSAAFEDSELDENGIPKLPFTMKTGMSYCYETMQDMHDHEIIVTEDNLKTIYMKSFVPIIKTEDGELKRIVYGEVLIPNTKDAHGEFVTKSDIEDAMHKFMLEYQGIGRMHMIGTKDVKIVESYIAPVDFELGDSEIKEGTWVMAVKVFDDAMWKEVVDGDLTGFSIYGFAKPVEDEIPVG